MPSTSTSQSDFALRQWRTSTITAETVTVDGIVVSRKDNIGILSTDTRAYSALGMIITLTDGRGRKIAEWGTGIQPVCYAYDSGNRLQDILLL